MQLGRERGQREAYSAHMDVANAMHTNFYQNRNDWDKIELASKDADAFVEKLEQDRAQPPRPFTIQDTNDQRRLAHLLGRSVPRDPEKARAYLDKHLPKGLQSDAGFSPRYYRKQQSKGKRQTSKPKLKQSPMGYRPRQGLSVRRRGRR